MMKKLTLAALGAILLLTANLPIAIAGCPSADFSDRMGNCLIGR